MRRLRTIELADLVRATTELALARYRLSTMNPTELLQSAYLQGDERDRSAKPVNRAYARRVSVAMGRMASRVPWQATCLVQALAARRWLARRGIVSSMFVGVQKEPSLEIVAHAWLISGGEVITGGDVSGYRELLSPEVISSLKANGRLFCSEARDNRLQRTECDQQIQPR
jgi:hypothetical protein